MKQLKKKFCVKRLVCKYLILGLIFGQPTDLYAENIDITDKKDIGDLIEQSANMYATNIGVADKESVGDLFEQSEILYAQNIDFTNETSMDVLPGQTETLPEENIAPTEDAPVEDLPKQEPEEDLPEQQPVEEPAEDISEKETTEVLPEQTETSQGLNIGVADKAFVGDLLETSTFSQEKNVDDENSIEYLPKQQPVAKKVSINNYDDYRPDDTELMFSYTLQGYNVDGYLYAYNYDDVLYLPFTQIANDIGITYKLDDKIITAYYQNDAKYIYTINLQDMTAKSGTISVEMKKADYRYLENTIFFSSSFLSRLFRLEIKPNYFNMELAIDGEKEFPTLVKFNASKKRKNLHQMPDRSFKDYEMDNRLIGQPVLDMQLGESWNHSAKNNKNSNSNSYALNFSGIAAGLDFNSYFSGNTNSNSDPTIRLNAGRVFLDEPSNALNLRTLKMGDISGINNSHFTNSSNGRGISVSSFKNLVMSADKTIDIVGPLTEGWEVELYWNNMLIGYRQNGINGEYNFPNIPVSFGLNKFKLVFYGPYGETRTEERRYYSGTSPVAKGQFGYNLTAYQPGQYMFDNNHSYNNSDTPVLDGTLYYGYTDNLTLIGGVTQTPDAETREDTQEFATVGAQYAVKGSSVQYNLDRNIDTGNLGHHLEWQGDVYMGLLYASYDDYNKIHSPISFYGGEYLKNKTEIRFNGSNPWNLPYSLAYRGGKKESDNTAYEDISARVSKNITSKWYLSIEDSYSTIERTNEVKPTLYHYWDNFTWQTDLTYETTEDKFKELNSQLTWRNDRYTYYTFSYRRDIPSKMDYYSLSGARVFPFGGVSLNTSFDNDKNMSVMLNYNMSFTKEPNRNRILTSANSKLSNTGSIYVQARDENGEPVKGVGLTANNLVNEVYTDENGNAFLTDLFAYEKTILNVDMESIGDLTLKPLFEQKKMVLRPGTLNIVDLPFSHVGSIEGQIANPYGKRLYGYKVAVTTEKGDEIAHNFADTDGYFLIEDVPYGNYKLVVSKDNAELYVLPDITVDDFNISLENDIDAKDNITTLETSDITELD